MALFNNNHHQFKAALPLLLLLLLLLTPHSLTKSTTLPFNNNTPPPPPPTFKKHPPPPPPPLNNNRRHNHHQFNNIIDALIGAGDFSSWANILSSSGPTALPLSATVFVPADDSLPPPSTNSPGGGSTAVAMDPLIFPYHIVPQRLSFSDLCEFKLLSRLPTLLASKSILITNNSRFNFTLDDSLISHPDIYSNSAIAIHGITTLLDYSVYGDSDNNKSSPPPARASAGMSIPGGEWMNDGDEIGGSDAVFLSAEAWNVLLIVIAVLAIKNV